MRIPDWSGISCALILATALVACGKVSHKTADVGEMSWHTIDYQGLEREYFVYLPPGYEAAAEFPVVFFLHGYGTAATQDVLIEQGECRGCVVVMLER